jgi:hypothetical protein
MELGKNYWALHQFKVKCEECGRYFTSITLGEVQGNKTFLLKNKLFLICYNCLKKILLKENKEIDPEIFEEIEFRNMKINELCEWLDKNDEEYIKRKKEEEQKLYGQN